MDLRPSSSFRAPSNSIPKRCCPSLSCILWVMEDLALLFFFWLHHAACGILVPPPGSVLVPSAVEAWGLNCWTAREVPHSYFLKSTLVMYILSSVQFSRSVVSDSLQPHGLQHARPPCPSQAPRVCSNSCPSSW